MRQVLLRARAIETQCYVAAAAQVSWRLLLVLVCKSVTTITPRLIIPNLLCQCGRHNSKRSSYGHALIVDPWGRVIADAGCVGGCASGGNNHHKA